LAVSHRIEVVEGPRRGDKVQPNRRTGLVIGRGKQTFDTMDPQVSTRHASIEWRTDRFWLRDLGSANGTRVNGVEVGPEGIVLGDGDQIAVGESVLRFGVTRSLLPQWVYWVALFALVLSVPGFLQLLIDWRLWDRMNPTIAAPDPVMGHGAEPVNPTGDALQVPLDRCFMREVASNGTDLATSRVTDFDGDGVSEIWVQGDTWERLYTFDRTNGWQLLGELPLGCQFSVGSGFRSLVCGNQTYQFRSGLPFQPGQDRCARGSNKGRYELSRQGGPTVWLPHPGGPIGVPTPYQVGLKGEQDLAAWLGERGVSGPVHFIVCEDMFPGMGAHVMTDQGFIYRLQPGCTSTVGMGGGRATDYPGRPYAIAFTETGRKHLIEQLAVFLGGSESHHFMNAEQRAWWDAARRQPTYHSASFVDFKPSPTAAARFFRPIPREDPRLVVRPFNRLGGLSVPGRLRAQVWSWLSEGTILQTPCGQYVKVDVKGWRCGPPCVRGTPFLEISQINGPKWTVPYQTARGKRLPGGKGIDVSVDVTIGPPGFVPQAVAASIAVRDREMCSGSPEFLGPEVRQDLVP
jgi:hypothetical protein